MVFLKYDVFLVLFFPLYNSQGINYNLLIKKYNEQNSAALAAGYSIKYISCL